MNIKRVHSVCGLIITVFVGLHLFNHLVSVFGVESHIELMNLLRGFYRNVFAETILLVAVFFQIVSGLKFFFSKRKLKIGQYEKLQIWTGFYLALFLIIHVSAILAGRYILNLDTNFYFGVAGLNTFPLNLFFIPYYSIAIIAFFGHLSAIHHQKMKSQVLGLSVGQQSKLILIIGIIVVVVIFYGLTNGFAGVEIPEDYNIIIGK